MKKEYTCIICPNGCEIEVETAGPELVSIAGAACSRGEEFVKQELINPQRNIATSLFVENGNIPLVSVKLTNPVPKAHMLAVVQEIKKTTLLAPVAIGQIIIKNVLGLDSDVIATRNVTLK